MSRQRNDEKAAGGYTRADGTVEFFTRVQALLSQLGDGSVVVDFGAGRGESAMTDPLPFRRDLQDLRGEGRKVIGLDVDKIVLTNPRVDESHVIEPAGRLPLADASVDVIVSDATFEHVDDPGPVVAELERVLKPGGWICARTPNKWGYIALASRAIPNARHVKVLSKLQPDRAAMDIFPTRYRMNTRGDLKKLFPAPRFDVHAYTFDSSPEETYGKSSRLVASGLRVLGHLPEPLGSIFMIFVQKAG